MSNILESFIVTISSGTTSFGSKTCRRLLSICSEEIPIFSLDENEQSELRNSIELPEAFKIGPFVFSNLESISALNSPKCVTDGDPTVSLPSEYMITDCSQGVSRVIQSTFPNYSFWIGLENHYK